MSMASGSTVVSALQPSIEEHTDSETEIHCGLSDSKNVDGRPVWEPPVFCYDMLIGEEYEQKRKGVLKYTGGDVVRATEILDMDIEFSLVDMYFAWSWDNSKDENNNDDSRKFFLALMDDVIMDHNEVWPHWAKLAIVEEKKDDGSYEVISSAEYQHRLQAQRQAKAQSYIAYSPSPSVFGEEISPAISDAHPDEVNEEATNSPADTLETLPDSASDSSDGVPGDSTVPPMGLLNLWW